MGSAISHPNLGKLTKNSHFEGQGKVFASAAGLSHSITDIFLDFGKVSRKILASEIQRTVFWYLPSPLTDIFFAFVDPAIEFVTKL
ncbi:MAG: hypothetical protein NC311_14055 [Muribaculaceae bacterium]|nr:hypothetical protein [Muribaculaceae bacterium]